MHCDRGHRKSAMGTHRKNPVYSKRCRCPTSPRHCFYIRWWLPTKSSASPWCEEEGVLLGPQKHAQTLKASWKYWGFTLGLPFTNNGWGLWINIPASLSFWGLLCTGSQWDWAWGARTVTCLPMHLEWTFSSSASFSHSSTGAPEPFRKSQLRQAPGQHLAPQNWITRQEAGELGKERLRRTLRRLDFLFKAMGDTTKGF